jgi:hypothetical protein
MVSLILPPAFGEVRDDKNDRDNKFNALLKGRYSFTVKQICEVNVEQVTDDLQLLSEPIILVEWVINGIVFFRGDGTGNNSFRALRFISGRQSADNILSGWSEGTCDLTYDVRPNRSFIGELICTGINSTGKAFTTSTIRIQGHIARDRQTLILSDANPTDEDIDIEDFGTLTGTCGRNGVAVKVGHIRNYLKEKR